MLWSVLLLYVPAGEVGAFHPTRNNYVWGAKPAVPSLTQLCADMTIQRGCQFYSIHYEVVEPKEEESSDDIPSRVPLVVLHGGPGVPSNYLRPLENLVTDRSILFYDQLGCGTSDQPDNEDVYSIDLYVDDLVQLLEEALGEGQDFHLYGQSFGGILAFEYLKRERPDHCRSVILSSTPTSVTQVEGEADRLIQEIVASGVEAEAIGEEFRIRHQVGTKVQPKPLADAYATAGTVFRGTAAIAEYEASLDGLEKLNVPALIMRGDKDFVTLPCIEDWKEIFEQVTFAEVSGCAHHGLLEDPNTYGKLVHTFLVDQD